MKRLIFSILAAMLLCTTAVAEGKGEIKFTTTNHDFGKIREDGGPVTTEFSFTNTGDGPLVIISAVASCGCTTPEYPRKPLQPGETGVIKVTYNPYGRPGEFNKAITVRTPDKRMKIKIKGYVIPKDR